MNKLAEYLGGFTLGKYIKASQKTDLEKFKDELTDAKYKKAQETLISIINSKIFTKKISESVDELLKTLTEEMSQEEKCDKIKNTIKIIEDESLEDELDVKCHRYNKFTDTNPAEHVRYNKANKNYVLALDEKEVKSKKLPDLVLKLKENIKHKKIGKFSEIVLTQNIEYKNKKIIIYIFDSKAYFDINHVVNLFDEQKSKDKKYLEYKSNIALFSMKDNEYGGFYIKEFVTKETFFDMIMGSNSIFSNKFKKEVSKILDELTDSGKLIIENDELKLTSDVLTKIKIDKFKDEYCYDQTYDNIELVDFIKKEIQICKTMNWHKYCEMHVMYFFVITLSDPSEQNRILCKIGYTADIIERIKSLEYEYKCRVYLLGMKTVKREQDEKQFHTELKRKYPEYIVNIKINKHEKDEVYVFDKNLYKSFIEYVDKVPFSDESIKLEKAAMDKMNKYFENIENRFEMDFLVKLKKNINIEKILNVHQKEAVIAINNKHYEYMISREKHLENMKDKCIIEKQNEFNHVETMEDKKLESKKLDLEILKLKNK